MRSVGEQLREEQRARAFALTPAERVARALDLGELGVRAWQGGRGCDRREAIRGLQRNRQRGRVQSACVEDLLR